MDPYWVFFVVFGGFVVAVGEVEKVESFGLIDPIAAKLSCFFLGRGGVGILF